MQSEHRFDLIIEPNIGLAESPVSNIAQLIFAELPHRDEKSTIILGHDAHSVIPVTLEMLRCIVADLFERFERYGIEPGSTVLLASLPGNNELSLSIVFLALTAFGVRVLLPMFMERGEIDEWLKATDCSCIISSGSEILALAHHDAEKEVERSIVEIAARKNLLKLDVINDLGLGRWTTAHDAARQNDLVKAAQDRADFETEALIITTSGSSGKSKLVVYTHGGCISSPISWQAAGFFDEAKFGGPGFTPLFAHTMGIRALFNAVWSGRPVCLIIPEWFMEKPETVKYFLMVMSPTHMTGGPALYNMMLEMLRNFPDLKQHLQGTIRTLVSSGAPYNKQAAKRISNAFGVVVHNAFGTTENQQTFNTLLCDNADKEALSSMGKPLPGVRAGLKKLDDDGDLYAMYLSSPFGHHRILGEHQDTKTADSFYCTGDIVRLSEDDRFFYHGRSGDDFFKDGFGVKVPTSSLTAYYTELEKCANHVEWLAIENSPGLAALLFVTHEDLPRGPISKGDVLKNYSRLVSKTNGELFKKLEPFEFRHRTIARIAVVNDEAPKTGKGTVSRGQILKRYSKTILRLVNPMSSSANIAKIDQTGFEPHSFTKYNNPNIGWALTALGIDYSYLRGEKDSLYTTKDGREQEILDFVGGYGVNLLGHNNPRLKRTVLEFLERDDIAISDQGSIQRHIGDLAEDLSLMVGKETGADYYVLFGNTGSEVVEIALHHALFEWKEKVGKRYLTGIQSVKGVPGRLVACAIEENKEAIRRAQVSIVSVAGSYHGHSAGARCALGQADKREKFANLLSMNRIAIDDRKTDWQNALEQEIDTNTILLKRPFCRDGQWELKQEEVSTVIAGIIEPVTGEGGIRRISDDVAAVLAQKEFPLISDEIQCGLGRTGSFPACRGAHADYYLFAKALGGNLEKISAILIDRRRYKKDFSDYYISTFANGGLAAAVAREALRIIQEDDVPRRARLAGQKLAAVLDALAVKYPDAISSVRGEGLMFGVELKNQSNSTNTFLRMLSTEKLAGALYGTYLLKRHNIRILPTVSAPNTLRIEPSAYIEDEEIERLGVALEDLCQVIERRSTYDVLSVFMDGDSFTDRKGVCPPTPPILSAVEPPAPGAVKVAFIAHFARVEDELRQMNNDLHRASDTGLRILFRRLQLLMNEKPFVAFAKNMFEGRVHFTFISLMLESAELEKRYRQGDRRSLVEKIQDAVNLAHDRGASVVSLGGYTSIITGNGTALTEPLGTRIITGNTLTAAAGVESLLSALKKSENLGDRLHLGIVGAAGNIGSIIAKKLARHNGVFKRMTLVLRSELSIAGKSVEEIKAAADKAGVRVSVTSEMKDLAECDVITIATNTNDPLLFPHHVNRDKPVYISDLSVPPAVSKAVEKLDNVSMLRFSSFVTLPFDPEIMFSSHTPPGTAFCCAAEAMLCGLEPNDLNLRGSLDLDGVEALTKLAKEHGLFDRVGGIDTFKAAL